MQNTVQQAALPKRRSILRHPFTSFILLGVFLIALQVIAIATDGLWPKTSVINGFATVIIYAIVGFGFSFLLGYAGLASLGTAGFVGLGTYFVAYFLKEGMPNIPYLLVMAIALAASLLLGLVVGFISLRIEGIFLAIVTLGISEVFYQLFNSWMPVTGGPNGARINVYPIFQRTLGMSSGDSKRAFYILLVVIMVALMMLTYNLGKSKTGRAMLAMKNSSSAAQAMGISLLKYRLLAFLLSTAYAVFAGVLFMSYNRSTLPTNYTIMLSLNILAAVLIGGSRSLIGTFVGSFIVFGMTPILFQNINFLNENAWLINVIIGIIIILIVMFYPGGLVQLLTSVRQSIVKKTLPTAAADESAIPCEQEVIQSAPQMAEISQRRADMAKSLKVQPPKVKADAAAGQGRVPKESLPEDVILRLDNLSMQFGGLRAVSELSFDVKRGEIFGLIGPNGAGKTTVFNCITQFYKSTGGDILYRHRSGQVLSLNQFKVHEIISKGIVRTFQNVEVIGELSILENLLVAAHPQYHGNLLQEAFNTPKVKEEERRLRERALKVLEYCGLTPLKDMPPVGQPYGVLKRIELARTLMAAANLIILDEPAAGLNEQETVELTQLIHDIQRDFDVTIFLVEHDMGLVMNLCDHICAISFGKKLAYGTPSEIQQDKTVQEAYLGMSDVAEGEAV
jgi:branched-chain amino acid transport system ATP-binding protein